MFLTGVTKGKKNIRCLNSCNAFPTEHVRTQGAFCCNPFPTRGWDDFPCTGCILSLHLAFLLLAPTGMRARGGREDRCAFFLPPVRDWYLLPERNGCRGPPHSAITPSTVPRRRCPRAEMATDHPTHQTYHLSRPHTHPTSIACVNSLQ